MDGSKIGKPTEISVVSSKKQPKKTALLYCLDSEFAELQFDGGL